MCVCLTKGSSHTSWKHCLGWRDRTPGDREESTITTLPCSLHVCATLHLALCRRASSERGGSGRGWGIGEGRGCGVEEEGRWVRLYSPAHSRPVVRERSSPENSSCSALWQDPPDCSPHKEPQLPEHYWLKEGVREQTARAPYPRPTPTPHPSLLHPPTYTDLLSLSYCLSRVPKLHPKTMHSKH